MEFGIFFLFFYLLAEVGNRFGNMWELKPLLWCEFIQLVLYLYLVILAEGNSILTPSILPWPFQDLVWSDQLCYSAVAAATLQ